MGMRWVPPRGLARLRQAREDARCRDWGAERTSPDALTFRRRSEVTDLAFLLLGGRIAARDFLDGPGPGGIGTMIETATASSHGQLEVSLLLRKLATSRLDHT